MSETVAEVRETRQERDTPRGSRRLSLVSPRPTNSELWGLKVSCGNHIKPPSGVQVTVKSLVLLTLRALRSAV